MVQEIQKLAKEFLSEDYIQIAVGRMGSTHCNIQQMVVWTEDDDKMESLANLLHSSPPCRTLIFANHKSTVDTIDEYLYTERGFPCTSIHSDRSQREREDALRSFKIGRCPILIATSVAARGLDIKNIMHVVNYDIAHDIDEYVHRIGRTARIGHRGLATTFYNNQNSKLAADLIEILEESKQYVPDFLLRHREEGGGERPRRRKDQQDGLLQIGKGEYPQPNADGTSWLGNDNGSNVMGEWGTTPPVPAPAEGSPEWKESTW